MRLLVSDQDSGSLKEIVFPLSTNTSDKAAPQPSSILVYAREGAARHVQCMARVGDKGQWIMAVRKDGSVGLYENSSPAAPQPSAATSNVDKAEEQQVKDAADDKKKEKFGCPTIEGSDNRFPLIYEWPAHTATYPKPENAPKYEKGDNIVGLVEEYPGGIVITLSKEGKLTAYDVIAATMNNDNDNHHEKSMFSNKSLLGSVDLPGKQYTCIATHPSQPGVIAVAGNDIEMQVYGTDWEKEDGDQASKITPIWAPKNVKRDHLDLPVPVWIEKLFFLEDPERVEPISSIPWSYIGEEDNENKKEYQLTTKIATVTHHGEVRIYDPVKRQRPVKRLTLVPNGEFLGTAGLGKIKFNVPKNTIQEEDEEEDLYSTTPLSLLVADRTTSIFVVNIDPSDQTNIKMTGKLHGATGAIGAFANFAQPIDYTKQKEKNMTKNDTDQYVVTGSLDRFVRVYDASSRKQVAKVFAGTRPTGIVVLDGFETLYGEGYDGETVEKKERRKQEKEDEDLWSKLDKAEDMNDQSEDDEDDEADYEEDEEVIIEEEEDENPKPTPKKRKAVKNSKKNDKKQKK